MVIGEMNEIIDAKHLTPHVIRTVVQQLLSAIIIIIGMTLHMPLIYLNLIYVHSVKIKVVEGKRRQNY